MEVEVKEEEEVVGQLKVVEMVKEGEEVAKLEFMRSEMKEEVAVEAVVNDVDITKHYGCGCFLYAI
jgi:hypothetical protein